MSDIAQPIGQTDVAVDLKDTASLLGSRICHDLISPLGAISNGLELLAMSGLPDSPELNLIEESIESANARVRFFRVAMGAASGSQVLARSEVLKLLQGCYSGGRIQIHWHPAADPSRTDAKVAFLALLCLESTLSQGGEIAISENRGRWTLQAYGQKIRFDNEVWTALDTGRPIVANSSQVQFLLLQEALITLERTPQIGHSDTAVSLSY
ncbi:MAG: histidine phosphotransferase family protein [Pseudomonadota bacterium]